jgi:phospholipase/carboxylesterase
MSLKAYIHSPKSGRKPTSMVILLHGLGANGADLIGLAQYWEQALPDTVFVSPDAPFPCDMAPVGFQWFSLQDWSLESMLEGAETAAPILNDFINKMLEEFGIPDEKLALAGFSQGTMMSLYAAPRRAKRIAGVLGYSGALIGAEGLTGEGIHKIPVRLIHGDVDFVVPLQAYTLAKSSLEAAGFEVSGGITRGLSHSIDEDGIQSGAEFLSAILS